MLEQLVKNWFSGTLLEDQEDFTLYCSPPKEYRSPLLRRKKASVDLLVCLKTDVVNFPAMVKPVLPYVDAEDSSLRRISAVWLVVSPRGGIYLYETIARKETRRYRGMKNRFLVFNSGDGSFSFRPGHVYNREHTEKMQNLVSQRNQITPVEFLQKFGALMSQALDVKG